MKNLKVEKCGIPEPFINDEFELFQKGIYDDPQINVFINKERDFAFLNPLPELDYLYYLTRVSKLKLCNYKKKLGIFEERFNRLKHLFTHNINSLVEIGAGEGSFLSVVKRYNKDIKLTAVEIAEDSTSKRKRIDGLRNYCSVDELVNLGEKFDMVCMFHVMEHIINPYNFLLLVRKLIHQDTLIIVEVPSLFDPLLSLYNCESYRKYFFQVQHPYNYSNTAIVRLMEWYGFVTKQVISYQKYGLENHLNWLVNNSPGGNEQFREIFNDTNRYYRAELESFGRTDTVFWIGMSR